MRWDQKPFLVQRECTCRRKGPECLVADAFHTVDGHDTLDAATADADGCASLYGFVYRAIRGSDGHAFVTFFGRQSP